MIGKNITHYRVTAKLGAGGMGEVYRARDERLGRDVALKMLPPAFASDGERMARFQREAQVLAYNKAIETSRKAGDNATADFLQDILKDEEMHVDMLEKQLSLIDQLGLTQYLAQQMGEPE